MEQVVRLARRFWGWARKGRTRFVVVLGLVTFTCVCCPMAAIGSLLDGGTATPTARPTSRSLLLPTFTEMPAATATQARAPTARATETVEATAAATRTQRPDSTATKVPVLKATPGPVATRTVVPMATDTRPPVPTATQAPVATATFAPAPTATFVPAATAPPASPVAVCDCGGDLYNCGDFATHAAAQACYEYCMQQVGHDVHGLDGNDGDGLACESLP